MDQKTQTSKRTTIAFDPFVAFKPLAPASWKGTVWFERVADLGSEITAFVADRIKEDVQTRHALLHCKSLTEVQHVQAEFFQKAFDQYRTKTAQLVEMTGNIAVDLQADNTLRTDAANPQDHDQ